MRSVATTFTLDFSPSRSSPSFSSSKAPLSSSLTSSSSSSSVLASSGSFPSPFFSLTEQFPSSLPFTLAHTMSSKGIDRCDVDDMMSLPASTASATPPPSSSYSASSSSMSTRCSSPCPSSSSSSSSSTRCSSPSPSTSPCDSASIVPCASDAPYRAFFRNRMNDGDDSSLQQRKCKPSTNGPLFPHALTTIRAVPSFSPHVVPASSESIQLACDNDDNKIRKVFEEKSQQQQQQQQPECEQLALIPTVHVDVPWISRSMNPNFREQFCAVCKGLGRLKVRVDFNGWDNEIVQCDNDEHMWLRLCPSDEWETILYGKEYFVPVPGDTSQVGIPERDDSEIQRRRRDSAMQVREWHQHGAISSAGGGTLKIMEVGGGSGYLTEAAVNDGMHCINVELSEDRAGNQAAKGHPNASVFCGRLTDAIQSGAAPLCFYDLVACYDLLEHVDPVIFLPDVHRVLKSNGVLAVRVPDTPALRGPRLHLGDHRQHFTRTSLTLVLRRHGFEAFHAHHSGTFHGKNGETIENVTLFARKI